MSSNLAHFGLRPPAMRPNGKIGVVSAASCVDGEALQRGSEVLRTVTNCEVVLSPIALERDGDFAGAPGARAAQLMEMWRLEDVDAIICSRGGYGSNYLLPLLDFEFLKQQPKAFVGYSDNTSLLIALDRVSVASFHGPMVASDFACGRVDERSFKAALGGERLEFDFLPEMMETLVPGKAQGTITGGCLSVVVASLGTPWEIDTEGKILFLEDVNEKPYRVDRMLMQLLLAGKFRGVRGVIFGKMLGCSAACADEESLTGMMRRILGEIGIPIVFGFSSGHVESGNITLPFGVPAVLHASNSGVRLQVAPATLRDARKS